MKSCISNISNLESSHSILDSIKLPVVPSRARQGIGAKGVTATCATGAVKGAFLRGILADATGPTPPSFGCEKPQEEISPFLTFLGARRQTFLVYTEYFVS